MLSIALIPNIIHTLCQKADLFIALTCALYFPFLVDAKILNYQAVLSGVWLNTWFCWLAECMLCAVLYCSVPAR
jgi:hypothetical protein